MDSEFYKKITVDVKTPEQIFVEIINFVQCNKNINKDIGNSISTNIINYSKIRNFSKETYVYNSDIIISDTFKVHFYFSNHRSYFSIDPKEICNFEESISFLQLINLKYCEKLFKEYNIDTFIYNFNKNSTKNTNKEISTQTNSIT